MLASSCLDGGNGLAGLGRDVEVLGAGDLGLGGREDDLDVAWVALVRVTGCQRGSLQRVGAGKPRGYAHTTVGTVSATTGLGGLLDDNVLDEQVLRGKVLGVGVGLGVLEETENELDRLDGPATLGGLEGLGLSGAAHGTVEAAEGNALLLLLNIAEVGVCLGQLHACSVSSLVLVPPSSHPSPS